MTQLQNNGGAVYAELPEFDSGDEPIWDAVFNWKGATPGVDALTKANAVESAIIDQLRDFADRTHALRVASHGQAPAQPVDFTTLGAAMRAIQQAIGLIGDPADERMQAVRRVLRGAVVVAEDSGDIPAQPDCLTCNDRGAVGNILTAEPCPDCTPSPQAAQLVFTKEWCMAAAKAEEESGADISAGVPASPHAAQQAPAGATPEGWVTWWPSPSSKGHEPIYSHGPKQPGYGAELDAVLRKYPVFAAPAAPSTLEAGGWMPIETAPKNGTRFAAVGHNYGLYSETQHTCIAQWFRGCWMEASDWNETSELKYLTHWMSLLPLPASPTIEGESNE